MATHQVQVQRYVCPECGRAICSTDGNIYSSGPDGRRIRYVYLRAHNAKRGVRCGRATVRVVGTQATE